ncbi:hypothetical protein Tco_1531433 [Tanacetum coccineum]
MPDEYHVECDSMNVAKRPHPDPLNIPFDGDAHNAIEYRSTNEYGSASSSNKTADIGRKKIIIRESTHINGDNVTTQARSCSDGRVYQSRDPYSYTSSLLNDKEQGPIPYTKHPSLPSKHGPLIHDMATQQMTTSATIVHSPSVNSSNSPPSAHTANCNPSIPQQTGNQFHLSCRRRPQRRTFGAPSQPPYDGTNNMNNNNVASNRDTRRPIQGIPVSNTEGGPSRNYIGNTRRQCNSVPLGYVYMGKCSCVCRHCGALFWECEKNVNLVGGTLVYNRCCNGGRVVLRAPPEYP